VFGVHSAVQHQAAVAVAVAARRRGCRSSSCIGTAVAAPLEVLLAVGYGSCHSGSGFGGFGILQLALRALLHV
jgi:hypothetical protein